MVDINISKVKKREITRKTCSFSQLFLANKMKGKILQYIPLITIKRSFIFSIENSDKRNELSSVSENRKRKVDNEVDGLSFA